jgi:RsiW-degrading membrane proteinase PrsW (M82 family)
MLLISYLILSESRSREICLRERFWTVYFVITISIALLLFIYYLANDRLFDLILIVLNATFSNSSALSWRPVLVVEEAGVPGENH